MFFFPSLDTAMSRTTDKSLVLYIFTFLKCHTEAGLSLTIYILPSDLTLKYQGSNVTSRIAIL